MNDNERIARLEIKMEHIENDIYEIKSDVRELRGDIRSINERLWSNFLWLTGTFITVSIAIFSGLSLMMAYGFHWI